MSGWFSWGFWGELPTLLRATLVLTAAAAMTALLLRRLRVGSPALQRLAWTAVLLQGVALAPISLAIPWHDPPPAAPVLDGDLAAPGRVGAAGRSRRRDGVDPELRRRRRQSDVASATGKRSRLALAGRIGRDAGGRLRLLPGVSLAAAKLPPGAGRVGGRAGRRANRDGRRTRRVASARSDRAAVVPRASGRLDRGAPRRVASSVARGASRGAASRAGPSRSRRSLEVVAGPPAGGAALVQSGGLVGRAEVRRGGRVGLRRSGDRTPPRVGSRAGTGAAATESKHRTKTPNGARWLPRPMERPSVTVCGACSILPLQGTRT